MGQPNFLTPAAAEEYTSIVLAPNAFTLALGALAPNIPPLLPL